MKKIVIYVRENEYDADLDANHTILVDMFEKSVSTKNEVTFSSLKLKDALEIKDKIIDPVIALTGMVK